MFACAKRAHILTGVSPESTLVVGRIYNPEMKGLYGLRKETIERDFAIAKELHGFRYTQLFGTVRMEMKAALTYLCLN